MSANPYAAPTANLEPHPEVADEAEALAIRQAHISHEASLKGVGTLWILGGVIMMIGTIGIIVPYAAGAMKDGGGLIVGLILVYALLGSLSLVCGIDMRRLKPRARVGGSILAVLSLLGVPLGTMLGIYVLYLIHGRKGQVVFGPDYARIVQLTPQVKYKTSVVAWVLLGLIVLLLVAGVVSALL